MNEENNHGNESYSTNTTWFVQSKTAASLRTVDPMKSNNLTSTIRLLALACALTTSLVVQAQPTISSVSPDGSRLFQYSPTLSFLASSPAGVTNVSVSLTVKKLDGGTSFQSLTPANGLSITGPSTGETVTANLKSNRLYSASITIQDANGATANQSVTFDTINPSYTFEVEDWNYTDTNDFTAGHYFDSPQTNRYAGRATTAGQDASSSGNGNHDYRPGGDDGSGGFATEGAGDNPKRAAYIGTGLNDYDVGWTDGGEFANYTRHFPAGTYHVYLRAANPNNPGTDNAELSGAMVGKFAIPNTGGWQNYQYVPLIDFLTGNPVEYVSDGSEQTVRLDFIQASCNVNFFLLVPPDTQIDPVGDIAFGDMYPNGAFQFQATNTFTFEATSSVDINASGISVQVNATNLFGQGTSQTLTSGSGLTVGGTPTARTVSFALSSNKIYSVAIQVLDANNNGASSNVVFDTISPAYVVEAEDWNYGGGLYFPEPQTNAYSGQDGVAEIDFHRAGGGGGNAYGNRLGLSTENAGDVPRENYIGLPDFDIGNAFGGNWCNYTRNFAAGNYNIFVRVSRGDGGSQVNAGSISTVTGATTDTQTASVLGTFDAPNTGGWQKYVWQTVRNGIGYPVVLAAGAGGEKTLRYTVTGGGHNPGFFLLMPADLSQASPPYVSDFKPDGSAMFQLTNKMTFTVNSTVGLTTGNIVVNLDGIVLTNLTITGSSTAWQVSAPIVANEFHTAIITLTDAVGTSISTNNFGAFSSANYQFEAEAYDFDGGQFVDNPQWNDYYQKGAIADVDYHDVATGGPYNYRTAGTATETITDLPRDQFNGLQEYNIAFFENGEWGNYTRNYPVGAYHVYLRVATGNGNNTTATLEKVTSGRGTTTQTTVPAGSFTILNDGWGTFRWSQLRDANNQPAVVIIDSLPATLRLGRPVSTPGANANFLMLVPVQTTQLKVARSGNTTSISLPAQTGYSYQVQYKNKLTDAIWTNVGSVIVGNNTIQSVNDTTSEGSRFYRAQVSQP